MCRWNDCISERLKRTKIRSREGADGHVKRLVHCSRARFRVHVAGSWCPFFFRRVPFFLIGLSFFDCFVREERACGSSCFFLCVTNARQRNNTHKKKTNKSPPISSTQSPPPPPPNEQKSIDRWPDCFHSTCVRCVLVLFLNKLKILKNLFLEFFWGVSKQPTEL